jgi:hypothetical protein
LATNPAVDGSDFVKFNSVGMSVWELREDSKYHQIGAFDNTTHTCWLTDCRIMTLCHGFKPGANSVAYAGIAPNLFLASQLRSAIQVRGRSLVGHLFYPQIDKVSVIGTGSRKKPNTIRLYVDVDTGEELRKLWLQMTLGGGTNPGRIAYQLVQRICRYYAQPKIVKILSDSLRRDFEALSNNNQMPASDSEWMTYEIPHSSPVRPT